MDWRVAKHLQKWLSLPFLFFALRTRLLCSGRPASAVLVHKERGPATSMALRRLALFKKSALATRDYSSPPIGFPDSQRPWVQRYFFNEEARKGFCPPYMTNRLGRVGNVVAHHFFNEEGGQEKDFAHPT